MLRKLSDKKNIYNSHTSPTQSEDKLIAESAFQSAVTVAGFFCRFAPGTTSR